MRTRAFPVGVSVLSIAEDAVRRRKAARLSIGSAPEAAPEYMYMKSGTGHSPVIYVPRRRHVISQVRVAQREKVIFLKHTPVSSIHTCVSIEEGSPSALGVRAPAGSCRGQAPQPCTAVQG